MSYELNITSDTAYEELIAEIVFGDGSIVVISQERSRSLFEVSFYAHHSNSGELSDDPQLTDLDDFMTAIAEAKERLWLLDVPKKS